MQAYLLVECFTPSHYNWILQLFIPSFTFYAIILPLAAFIYMSCYACSLHLDQHKQKVGFLSNGYRKKKFYWEFFFFYRKIVILFISQFFLWRVESKTLLVLLILFVSLWRQAKDNPFITEDLNSMDFRATVFGFCTLFAGLFSYDFIETPWVTVLFTIIVFFLNIFFILTWIKRLIVVNRDFFKKNMLKRIFKRFHPYIKRLDNEFEVIKKEALNSLLVFEEIQISSTMEKGKKLSLFNALRSRLSKIGSPIFSNKNISQFEDSDREHLNFPSKTILKEKKRNLTESEVINKRSPLKKVSFPDKISTDFREIEKEHIPISEVKLPNLKINTFEDNNYNNDLMKELLTLKDQQIKSLYEEVKGSKKELEWQKQENKVLSQVLSELQLKTNKINEINLLKPKPVVNFSEITMDSGYFVQNVAVSEKSMKRILLKNQEIEVPTPLFSLFIKRQLLPNHIFIANFVLSCKHFQNKSCLQSISLQSSKDLFLSKHYFVINSYHDPISFLITKTLDYAQKNTYLLIESFLIASNGSTHKIQVQLPIKDWLFLDMQPSFTEINETNELKLLIFKEILGIERNKIDSLLNHMYFRENGLVGSIKIMVEGNNILNLLIKIQYSKGVSIELFSENLDEIPDLTQITHWIDEVLINEYIIFILNE